MSAAQQNPGPDDETAPGPRRWTEPDPAEVAQQIALYRSMANDEFAETVAAFILASTAPSRPEDYELQACAIRSPELARRAQRAIPGMIRDPDNYLGVRAGESNHAYRDRVGAFRSRAEREALFLHSVLVGEAARKGFFLADPNPRGRARRRLADEYPVRFLELVKEERQADVERAAAEAAERKRAKAEAKRQARAAQGG